MIHKYFEELDEVREIKFHGCYQTLISLVVTIGF
jgi:hypothetical protein